MLYRIANREPNVHESAYIAPSAQVIGSVDVEANCSVWFNAVIRGDADDIVIGEGSNVQDFAMLHTDPGFVLKIHKGVTIGHHATLHGCVIGEFSLIGINAAVLNGANIGKYCVIGANALITENMEVPDGSVVMGSPAKIVKRLNDKQKDMLVASSLHYQQNARDYAQSLRPL